MVLLQLPNRSPPAAAGHGLHLERFLPMGLDLGLVTRKPPDIPKHPLLPFLARSPSPAKQPRLVALEVERRESFLRLLRDPRLLDDCARELVRHLEMHSGVVRVRRWVAVQVEGGLKGPGLGETAWLFPTQRLTAEAAIRHHPLERLPEVTPRSRVPQAHELTDGDVVRHPVGHLDKPPVEADGSVPLAAREALSLV